MQNFSVMVSVAGQLTPLSVAVSDAYPHQGSEAPFACRVLVAPLLAEVILYGNTPFGAASNAFGFVDVFLREKFGDASVITYA